MKTDQETSATNVTEIDITGLLEKASVLFKEKKYEEAIAHSKKITSADPQHAEAWNLVGNALFEQGKHEEAIASYDKVSNIDPVYIDAYGWNSKGNALLSLGKYTLAIECYERAIKVDAKHSWAWRNKGQALLNLAKYEEAIKCYDEAIELDPMDVYALMDKGFTLDNLGKKYEAIDCYDKAIEIDPNLPFAWIYKGWTLYNSLKYDESLKCFEKSLELDPNNIDAWNHKGNSLLGLSNYDAAIRCYEKALELDSNYVPGWNNKGIALYNQGKKEESKTYFRKAIELSKKAIEQNRDISHHWLIMGTSFRFLEIYTEAERAYNEVLKIDPNNIEVLLGLNFIYSERTNELEKAIIVLRRALEVNPDLFQTRINYVEALLKNGNYPDARAEALEILPKAPENRYQCLILFLLLTSYVVENDSVMINTEFANFIQFYWDQPEPFIIVEELWSFEGMINIFSKSSLNLQSKFLLLTLIDLLQGKISRQEISFSRIFLPEETRASGEKDEFARLDRQTASA